MFTFCIFSNKLNTFEATCLTIQHLKVLHWERLSRVVLLLLWFYSCSLQTVLLQAIMINVALLNAFMLNSRRHDIWHNDTVPHSKSRSIALLSIVSLAFNILSRTRTLAFAAAVPVTKMPNRVERFTLQTLANFYYKGAPL